MILPVITTPYASRVLQSDGMGQFSFSDSIAFYFGLLAALGFGFYAQREISKHQGDLESQSKIFWEIMIVKAITTLVSIGLMFGLAQIPYFSTYKVLLYILLVQVAAVLIDTTFLFQGNEDFKLIAGANMAVKTLIVIGVFVFVKTSSDLWIYVLLHALNPFVTALVLLPFLKKYLVKVSPKELQPKKHVVPCLRLFIPTIAVSVYNMLDRTMIGFIIQGDVTIIKDGVETVVKAADVENGYYIQAEKIVRTFVAVMLALGVVMMPRNSALLAQGNHEKVKENVGKAVRFVFFLGAPMTAGLAAVSASFCPWFFGEGYEKVPLLISCFSPLILFVGLNAVFANHYLIPAGLDKKYTISVVSGAIFNVVFNAISIYFLGSLGAVLASISAEFFILIIELVMLRGTFSMKEYLLKSWKHLVGAVFVFAAVFPLNYLWPPKFYFTIAMVLIGAAVYFLTLLILRDETLFVCVAFAKKKVRSIFKKSRPVADAVTDQKEKADGESKSEEGEH